MSKNPFYDPRKALITAVVLLVAAGCFLAGIAALINHFFWSAASPVIASSGNPTATFLCFVGLLFSIPLALLWRRIKRK